MTVKCMLMAVVILLATFGALSVAHAQTFTNGGNDPDHLLTLGWNYGHASYCWVGIDKQSNTTWLFLFPQRIQEALFLRTILPFKLWYRHFAQMGTSLACISLT